jgi:hypothetical protein
VFERTSSAADRARITENLYLIAGIRGSFELRSARVPDAAEAELLHTLDRWGVSPPWGACDSGCDLESPGDDVLRGWCHVDLGGFGESPPEDAPVSALLRTTWDTLQLFGATTLTGVDAIVPLACAGEPLWRRVAGSVVRDDSRGADDAPSPRVSIQAGPAWSPSSRDQWETQEILERLSELVDIAASMDAVEHIAYPGPTTPDPFAPSDPDLVRAEAVLRDWMIDDAAWLVEAFCASCRRAGLRGDVQIAVRRRAPR